MARYLFSVVVVLALLSTLLAADRAISQDEPGRARGERLSPQAIEPLPDQGSPDREPDQVVRTFRLRYRQADALLPTIQMRLSGSGQLTWGREGLITVRDSLPVVRELERVLEEYDVPPKEFKFNLRLLLAYTNLPGPPRPPRFLGLDDVHGTLLSLHKKLMRVFKFEGYRQLDEAELRGVEGEEVVARVASGDYTVRFRSRYGEAADHGVVTLEGFELADDEGARLLRTTVNVGIGHTVILGKSRAEKDADALITVVSAHLAGEDDSDVPEAH